MMRDAIGRGEDRQIVTAQPVEVVAGPGGSWPRQQVEAELAAMLGRRLDEAGFLGPDLAPFRDVLGRLLLGPGKRLRPAFVYWGFRAAGGESGGPEAAAAVRVGCAVEFLHACALICDDLMDGSAVRRWEPAAHVALAGLAARSGWPGDPGRFGQAAALLLGLQAYGWADAALAEAGLPGERLAAVLRLFTTLRTEVTGGQYLDLVNAHRGGADAATAGRIARYKSAKYTVERPVQLGAAVAGRDDAGFLTGYSLPLGEAFQLRDDVLGVFGDPRVTGKPAGEDIREGKQTLLLVLGRQLAGPDGRRVLDAAAGNPGATESDIAGVRATLAGCGALAEVERQIARLAARAQAALGAGPALPADAQSALLALAGRATWRGR
jgi:geranylgeranyl diphosphate synthase, type I